ncbi:MAG: DsrE family protein [Undibacterium sp.]|uniref:DsrE/DsrF/TusD sulfur relay family protein n=1 Tax=Undibacterium sp. TaxID=1914977 RepID=UPI00271806BA|nr:DsrE family protein [Undibacterium sp.]MDO8651478.1 DsrE family protein [Undibacterium sp.]
MKTLFIFNGAAYGDERTYNGLRLAGVLAKRNSNEVRAFLMGDAVTSAKAGQKVPEGYYNLQIMLTRVAREVNGAVGVCGTCMDARGIQTDELIDGALRGTLEQLADWSEWAEQVFVF